MHTNVTGKEKKKHQEILKVVCYTTNTAVTSWLRHEMSMGSDTSSTAKHKKIETLVEDQHGLLSYTRELLKQSLAMKFLCLRLLQQCNKNIRETRELRPNKQNIK